MILLHLVNSAKYCKKLADDGRLVINWELVGRLKAGFCEYTPKTCLHFIHIYDSLLMLSVISHFQSYDFQVSKKPATIFSGFRLSTVLFAIHHLYIAMMYSEMKRKYFSHFHIGISSLTSQIFIFTEFEIRLFTITTHIRKVYYVYLNIQPNCNFRYLRIRHPTSLSEQIHLLSINILCKCNICDGVFSKTDDSSKLAFNLAFFLLKIPYKYCSSWMAFQAQYNEFVIFTFTVRHSDFISSIILYSLRYSSTSYQPMKKLN